MQENQNIQKSVLFDESIPYIKTSSNNSNVVHKKFATSTISNNTKNKHNTKFSCYFVCFSNPFFKLPLQCIR